MRSEVFISHIFFFTSLFLFSAAFNGLAQDYKPYNTFNKETELRSFIERGGKVEEITPNIYRLIYLTGESRLFNFNSKKNFKEGIGTADTTIINMWEIDTTKYNDKFVFWQRVEINNEYFFTPPFVDDLNRNGKPEIYGKHNSSFPGSGPVEIYERNDIGIFESIYTYPDSGTLSVQAMGEIHGSGEKEIFINYRGDTIPRYVVYESDSIGALPITLDFFFYYKAEGQINHTTFGDFDNNGKTDAAFINGFSEIIISEFRDSVNNFTTVYEHVIVNNPLSGFAIGDFEEDGNKELIIGSAQDTLYSIEAIKENLYEMNWKGNFSTSNAYMITSTNDIDGNGKPEFWIGGQDFQEGITRLECYEATGNNEYESVALIELRYINSLSTFYLQAKDLDGNGEQELILSIANTVLILKFKGAANNHRYEVYYVKIGEATEPTADFQPLTTADLDGDGEIDLLLPFQKSKNGHAVNFSYILRQPNSTGVDLITNNSILETSIRSYPNPFNSTSSIKFLISEKNFVKIRVYNSLGKEIKTIIEGEYSPGEYDIQWEAKDRYGSPLPSGVYFISLQAGNVIKTTKTILLK